MLGVECAYPEKAVAESVLVETPGINEEAVVALQDLAHVEAREAAPYLTSDDLVVLAECHVPSSENQRNCQKFEGCVMEGD